MTAFDNEMFEWDHLASSVYRRKSPLGYGLASYVLLSSAKSEALGLRAAVEEITDELDRSMWEGGSPGVPGEWEGGSPAETP